MPKKAKYTKDDIGEAAFLLIREYGEDALSARALAAKLGVSTAPIFTAFDSIEDVRAAAAERAKALYKEYLDEGLKDELPFKGAGLKYIEFAKREPNLFKFLFMGSYGEGITHYMPGADENEERIREKIEDQHEIDTENAKWLYNHMSVYVHGIASMFAMGRVIFSDEDVSKMLSEVFISLKRGVKNENN